MTAVRLFDMSKVRIERGRSDAFSSWNLPRPLVLHIYCFLATWLMVKFTQVKGSAMCFWRVIFLAWRNCSSVTVSLVVWQGLPCKYCGEVKATRAFRYPHELEWYHSSLWVFLRRPSQKGQMLFNPPAALMSKLAELDAHLKLKSPLFGPSFDVSRSLS